MYSDFDLGELFKSSTAIDLTKDNKDYIVCCIKHVYNHYIVFQVSLEFN